MIAPFIKAYVANNKIVKISNLGTFELAYREAGVHPIRQDFTPPGEYLTFTPNDTEEGAEFAAYVAGEMKVELLEAQSRIAAWVQEVRQALESRQTYALGEMGNFVMGNVRMEFVPKLDPELSPDTFGLSSFSLRTAAAETAPVAETPAESPTEATTPKKTPAETPQAIRESAAKTESGKAESGRKEKAAPKPERPRPKHRVGRTIGYSLLIIILLVIIFVGVYALLRPESFVEKKDHYVARLASIFHPTATEEVVAENFGEAEDEFWEENETEAYEVQAADTVEAVEESMETPDGQGNCYVIIGGFGNPANADKLVESLKSRFPNAANLGLNPKGTMTMVGIGPYTQAEAEQKVKELERSYKDCWILEK